MSQTYGHGLWFEEFTEGLTIESRGRTITEADIINFAGISGDFNPMHTNADYMKDHQFGARVAHGALVFSIATGLLYQLGVMEGTVVAFTGFEMKLRAPVYIGDTIKVNATVSKKRAMAAAGGGMVSFDIKVTNQKGETTQKGEWTVMILSKPGEVPARAETASSDE
jgi:3-hydroxybutyryl-CoA dehydratase